MHRVQQALINSISYLILSLPFAGALWLITGLLSYIFSNVAQFLSLSKVAYSIMYFNRYELGYVNLYIISVVLIIAMDVQDAKRYKKIVKNRRARTVSR